MLLGSGHCGQDLGGMTPAAKSCNAHPSHTLLQTHFYLSPSRPHCPPGLPLPQPQDEGGVFPLSPGPTCQAAPLCTLAPTLQPSSPTVLVLPIFHHLACGRCLCSSVWGPRGASSEGGLPHSRAHSPWGLPPGLLGREQGGWLGRGGQQAEVTDLLRGSLPWMMLGDF